MWQKISKERLNMCLSPRKSLLKAELFTWRRPLINTRKYKLSNNLLNLATLSLLPACPVRPISFSLPLHVICGRKIRIYYWAVPFYHMLGLCYRIVQAMSGGFRKAFTYCSTINECVYPEDGPKTADYRNPARLVGRRSACSGRWDSAAAAPAFICRVLASAVAEDCLRAAAKRRFRTCHVTVIRELTFLTYRN
jgi:hypothetical protein